MDKTIAIQSKIRQDALVMQDLAKDLNRWESSIKTKDTTLKSKRVSATKTVPPPRNGNNSNVIPPVRSVASNHKVKHTPDHAGIAYTNSSEQENESPPPAQLNQSTADAHTYDKGYSKWDKFNVEQALQEVDESISNTPKSGKPNVEKSSTPVTPATIVSPAALPNPKPTVVAKPKKQVSSSVPRDVVEKQKGNEYYAKGDFTQAIKCYSRAISFNPKNHVLHSNRAMAYLKVKEYRKAEEDCTTALEICNGHIKSLTRRGTARNNLGMHRAAVFDFSEAMKLDPSNKQARTEYRKTRELIKASLRRTPRVAIPVTMEREITNTVEQPGQKLNKSEIQNTINCSAQNPTKQNSNKTIVEGSSRNVANEGGAISSDVIDQQENEEQLEPQRKETGPEPQNTFTDPETKRNNDVLEPQSNHQTVLGSPKTSAKARPNSLEPVTTPDDAPKLDTTITSTNRPLKVADAETTVQHKESEVQGTDDADVRSSLSKPTNEVHIYKNAIGPGVSASILKRAPKTSYEFLRSWRSLLANHIPASDRYSFLTQTIGPIRFPKLIGSILEADLIVDIVSCLDEGAQEETALLCCKLMEAITTVASFKVTVMFFGKKENSVLNSLFQTLKELGVEATRLTQLAKNFGL